MTKILIDEALRLADAIELAWLENVDADKADIDMIQAELRQLYAENQALRQALEKLAKLGNGDRYGNSIGNSIAREALDKMAENARELGLSYEQPALVQDDHFAGGGKPMAEQPAQQEPDKVRIEYWLQDTMESGRWVTTDNMAKSVAEKMLSGEYGDVFPEGRIVEAAHGITKGKINELDS